MRELSVLLEEAPGLRVLGLGRGVKEVLQPLQDHLLESEGGIETRELDSPLGLDFSLPNRAYEAAILYDIDHNDQNFIPLLRKMYDSLETTATVIVVNRGEDDLLFDLIPLLEEGRLQNANSIELVHGHNVIVAKKLQMWV
ncbi:MAG: hypothetical protein ACQERK_00715 [Campylobacterota bacterium]